MTNGEIRAKQMAFALFVAFVSCVCAVYLLI
jgi:hypothetical protein